MRIIKHMTEMQSSRLSVQLFEDNDVFGLNYMRDGVTFKTETFPGKSMHYVNDTAENWLSGLKTLAE